MSVLPIVTIPANGLRSKNRAIHKFDDDIKKLITDMIETLDHAEGAGLAAPQIGQQLQLAIVWTLPEVDDDGRELDDTRELFVVANPEIYWRSRETVKGIEGCLSIPGYVGEVERAESIRVRGLDQHGRKFQRRFDDWTARIFQHEIDHLNGVLFIDKLTGPENIWTEEEFEQIRGARSAETDIEHNPAFRD